MKIILLLLAGLGLASQTVPTAGGGVLSPHVKKIASPELIPHLLNLKGGKVNCLVSFTDTDTKSIHDKIAKQKTKLGFTLVKIIDSLVGALKSHCTPIFAKVHALLDSLKLLKLASLKVTELFVSCELYLEHCSLEIITLLAKLPGILSIQEDTMMSLIRPLNKVVRKRDTGSGGGGGGSNLQGIQWGPTRVGANKFWEQYNQMGKGVTVGILDTGVYGSHPDLVTNMRKSYAWYDPYNKTSTPGDDDGHGTHVTGIICGTNGTGVAPGAEWMACKACNSNGCSSGKIKTCMQWFTQPTDTSGKNGDSSKAPSIINNSWGTKSNSTEFDDYLKAWNLCGIMAVFAAGNSGDGCSTHLYPAESPLTSISVGSIDLDDYVSSFSSRGPCADGRIFPTLSAPGDEITSTFNDGGYMTWSGTSMACPHVVGCLALLRAEFSNTTMTELRDALVHQARAIPDASDQTCGGTAASDIPNNIVGAGCVDVMAAAKSLKKK